MQAFFNDPEIKAKYVNRVHEHILADNLVRGATGEDGKGCAVWCTLNAYKHSAYEDELGIPEWLAYLEDILFERMNIEKTKTWPLYFLESINVGSDLDKIKVPFLIMVLKRNLKILDELKPSEYEKINQAIIGSKKAVNQVIDALNGKGDLAKARMVAWRAVVAAARAAEIAESATSAARTVFAVTYTMVAVEDASANMERVVNLASAATIDYFADELIKLIKDCKYEA